MILLLLVVNAVAGILIVEWILNKCSPILKINEERDSKYPAYRRHDTHLWTRWRLYPGAMTYLIPRTVIAVFLFWVMLVIVW